MKGGQQETISILSTLYRASDHLGIKGLFEILLQSCQYTGRWEIHFESFWLLADAGPHGEGGILLCECG